jgi:hypothetical protein
MVQIGCHAKVAFIVAVASIEQRFSNDTWAYWNRSVGDEEQNAACAAYTNFQVGVDGLVRGLKPPPPSVFFIHSKKSNAKATAGPSTAVAAATFAQDDKAVEFIEACGFPGLKIETWGNRRSSGDKELIGDICVHDILSFSALPLLI